MTTREATAATHSRRNPGLSGAAAARHRRVPAHDRAALRRPREVDQGARRGDALRHVHPARHAEERLRRRSGDRRHLRDRHARERAAAAQAARRHRQGAGRGRRSARKVLKYTDRSDYYEADAVALADDDGRAGRGRGACALGHHRVRELREAQQEGVARGGRRRPADRGLCQARRHGRLAPRRQDPRQAGDPGDHRRSPSGWRRCSA